MGSATKLALGALNSGVDKRQEKGEEKKKKKKNVAGNAFHAEVAEGRGVWGSERGK